MNEELVNKIEAMLFATGRDIQIDELSVVLELPNEEIEKAVETLKTRYENRGIKLIKIANGYQMVSNNIYYEDVCKLYEESKARGVTKTAMEVLSIIAYNPKITKGQIEKIRGVNSDAAVNRLVEFSLVTECGRLNAPGRPAIYKTTNEFLINFGLSDIKDLPDYETLKTEQDDQTTFDEILEE
ncbi:MAG: SMC-Scp complex subunit ScpB [Clostridia bacterium]